MIEPQNSAIKHSVGVQLIRKMNGNTSNSMQPLPDRFNPKGKLKVEHWRQGQKIGEYDFPNDITNEGKNYIFDVMFSDGTQIPGSSWYIGLVNASGFSAFAATDTMSSHSGWTELTGYTQANRVAWGPGNPASQQITNASPATFNMNATGTVHGIFITSNNTKSGTTGTLWATAAFTSQVPVVNGDELKVTYTVNA